MSNSIKYIPGEGPKHADVVIVGEAPGEQEDIQGRPFVGRSGQLLTKMIEFMGLKREEVYITNICKIRPENNRTPSPEEIKSWRPVLIGEIQEISPILVITLGASATKALIGGEGSDFLKISEIQGVQFNADWLSEGRCALIPLWHPSYLLRNPKAKEEIKPHLLNIKSWLGK